MAIECYHDWCEFHASHDCKDAEECEGPICDQEDCRQRVHITHCCIVHGCKYNDPNCGVALGKIKQEYLCEYCSHDDINSFDELMLVNREEEHY